MTEALVEVMIQVMRNLSTVVTKVIPNIHLNCAAIVNYLIHSQHMNTGGLGHALRNNLKIWPSEIEFESILKILCLNDENKSSREAVLTTIVNAICINFCNVGNAASRAEASFKQLLIVSISLSTKVCFGKWDSTLSKPTSKPYWRAN